MPRYGTKPAVRPHQRSSVRCQSCVGTREPIAWHTTPLVLTPQIPKLCVSTRGVKDVAVTPPRLCRPIFPQPNRIYCVPLLLATRTCPCQPMIMYNDVCFKSAYETARFQSSQHRGRAAWSTYKHIGFLSFDSLLKGASKPQMNDRFTRVWGGFCPMVQKISFHIVYGCH